MHGSATLSAERRGRSSVDIPLDTGVICVTSGVHEGPQKAQHSLINDDALDHTGVLRSFKVSSSIQGYWALWILNLKP